MPTVATLRGVYCLTSPLVSSLFSGHVVHSVRRNVCHTTAVVALSKPKYLLPVQQSVQARGLADTKNIKENVDKYREGQFDTIPDPSKLEHFRSTKVPAEQSVTPITSHQPEGGDKAAYPIGENTLPHPIWTQDQLEAVSITHKPPQDFVDKCAYKAVQTVRAGFDLFSGFKFGQRNEKKWINRICFLETVAGVPGMVAAMMRHMKSLRRMQRDHGWIHTLLEEAENERMHLLTALQLKEPSLFFRLCVIGSQGVFLTLFGASYLVSPRFCHRFVGYLEEEAVKTYTTCLKDIDSGPMQHWKVTSAPDVAIRYWKLKPEATMRDVILVIRADEAHHRVVNHCFASLKKNEFNPYKPGE